MSMSRKHYVIIAEQINKAGELATNLGVDTKSLTYAIDAIASGLQNDNPDRFNYGKFVEACVKSWAAREYLPGTIHTSHF